MRSRWYVWLLASTPAVVVVLAAVFGVLDRRFLSSRASIVLSGLAITFVALSLLALASRPWRVASPLRRVVAVAATGLAAAAAVLFGAMAVSTLQEEVFDSSLKGALIVVASDRGVVAVGNDASGNAVVWLSESGESWARVVHSDALAGVEVADVTMFESDILVVGQDTNTGEGVVLTSADGTNWNRAATKAHNLDPPTGIEMTRLLEDLATTAAWQPEGVAALSGDLVAVGDTYGNAVVFWRSSDGVVWSVAEPFPIFDTGNEALDVVAPSFGFVALGSASSGDPEVWTSQTGEAWNLLNTAIDGHPTHVAATSTVAILVETIDSGVRTWRSLDGSTWTRHEPEALRGVRVEALASTPSGFVAVGTDSADNRVMWFSQDGSTWTIIASHPNPSDTDVYDITPLGASFIAVGYDRVSDVAAFWTVDEQAGWVRVVVDEAPASLG